jgi:hypothetical protein
MVGGRRLIADRQAVPVRSQHLLGALAPLGLPDRASPFSAGMKRPSRNALPRSGLSRSSNGASSPPKPATIATDVKVYTCDAKGPWQRGTSENTNRLMCQYPPKGTDLSAHSQYELDLIALKLNT